MAVIIPTVTNWSVKPQNGVEGYFALMNTWIYESTDVINSLQTAIVKMNESSVEINTINENVNTKVSQAVTSANNASNSATTASNKANEAYQSASDAAGFKNQAQSSATTATNEANRAKNYADSINPAEGVSKWNEHQNYYINSIAKGSDGELYKSLTGTAENPNVGNDPLSVGSTAWKSILSDYALKNGSNQNLFKVKDAVADDEAINKKQLDESLANVQPLPIGAILNGYTIFNNCIVAFGGEFNRADYPKLWAYLQANPTLVKTQAQWTTENTTNGMCGFFSDGNGTTTFRVPNLDKAFLRPDSRTVGSYQADEFKSHTHELRTAFDNSNMTHNASRDRLATGNNVSITQANDGAMSATGGTETRPKNIAVLPLIVAK